MNRKSRVEKCVECGGEVRYVTGEGRTTVYKGIEIPVPEDLAINTCAACGEEYMAAGEAKTWTAAFEKVYREIIRTRLIAALLAIGEDVPQRRIERAFGLSAGYLSKLKQGDSDASPGLVSGLSLLAINPNALEQLETIWSIRRGRKKEMRP